MSDKRFETYEVTKQSRPPTENCSTCEHYYTGACDGLRGWCSSYKQYRARTLEELVKIGIGTTTILTVTTWIIMLAMYLALK